MKIFYTYLHCKPDGTPFYVGKGFGARAYNFYNRNIYHKRIVEKYGKENIKVYVFNCDSEAQALADEVQQIAQLRAEGYELCNMSSGGDGGTTGLTLSEEHKRKISISLTGRKLNAEHKIKIKKSAIGNKYATGNHNTLGHKLSIEHKQKVSKSLIGNKRTLGYKHSEESRKKISAALIGNTYTFGHKHSEETKNKMSIAGKNKILSDEHKLKISISLSGRKLSETHKLNLSISKKNDKHKK